MQAINNLYKIIILQIPRKLVGIVSGILLVVSIVLGETAVADNDGILKVAVASNFLLPMKHLKAEFEKKSPLKIKITAASTAKLYAQILNGAPYDVFLAADRLTPQKLLAKSMARHQDVFQYVQGQLVLWSVKSRFNSSEHLRRRLMTGDFDRLALANPKTAPYGRAAMQVLRSFSINVKRTRLILGESVGQAYQFTGSGNVDMGFVALSQIKGRQLKAQGQYWVLPSDTYLPIQQHGVVLRGDQQHVDAQTFVRYLKSPEVQTMLRQRFGYL